MNPKVREIFTRAAVLPAGEREAFLAEACGSDAELRLEVQRLLMDAERADSFLGERGDEDEDGDKTVGMEESNERFSELEGDVVGVYTLRQKIGEGGFGVVWMAEQSQPISRMVALKVVKAGMDTRQVLARFEAERQALAMMDHPNIAKVLDAGATSSGRPYFAMELVKGVPITEFCNDQKYGPRERLELFRDVCSAVNHAHQKGIIHRDLKPSNVMVTLAADKPVVKVIDFGIAKATHSKLTEKTLFTRFEQFLGTPVYMSPEQAAMSAIDVDTRSDIYSLGVLLYELLAGAPPFDAKSLLSAGYDEMRRVIREDEPAKPSTKATQTQALAASGDRKKVLVAASALKGELDWIVMKAIDKDRTRRYETANAFAADIGRYLADEPVQAAAPGAAYKFRKFARRNKASLGVAAAMVLLLVAGIAATSWQAVRATAEQKVAEEERDRANEAEDLAEARLVESEKAREEAEAISSFLTGMFESTRPGDEQGGRDVLVRDILDRAVERLDTELADQPERKAKLQATLGLTYYTLGHYQQAIDLLEKVLDCWRRDLGPEHFNTIRTISTLAASYSDAGRRAEAIEMQKEAVKLFRKVFGPEHPDTLMALTNLANSYHKTGHRDEATQIWEEVLEISRKVLGPEYPVTILTMQNLATSYYTAGRKDEALEMFEYVLEMRRRYNGPEHPETVGTMHNLAVFYHTAGREEEALEMGEEVVELFRKLLGPEHSQTLSAMGNLASLYSDADREEEALEKKKEVLKLSRKVLGPEHPQTLLAMQSLALSYSAADRFEEALEMGKETLTLCRRFLGPEHPQTAQATVNLGFIYDADGSEPEKAIAMWQEGVRIDPELSNTQYWLGKALVDRQRHEEALAPLNAAHEFLPAGDPKRAQNLQRLRETLVALGREEEARKLPEAELDDGDQDGPQAEVAGLWVDSNEGSIKIEQDGAEVVATGQNEKVTEWWTKGVGELKGRALTMTHYKGEQRTDVQRGVVTKDGSRIDWANGSHWERVE